MYGLRMVDMLHPLELVVVIGCSWLGGLLLARHAFRLRPDERLLAGAGIGMAAFVGLANMLGHLWPAESASWGAGLLVLPGGPAGVAPGG
jgi:hypothetical protein